MSRLEDYFRSKSKEAKSRYAFGLAGTITGVIALIWLSTLPSRFAAIPNSPEESAERGAGEFIELLDETKAQMGNALQGLEPTPESEPAETANLDMLLSGEATSGELTGTSPAPETVISTSTKPAESENESETPRTILIGTTTEPTP